MNNLISQAEIIALAKTHFYHDSFFEIAIKTRQLCSHGSEFDDCFELFECFEEEFPDAQENNVSLLELLKFWLPLRFDYLSNEIINELNYSTDIYRQLILTPEQVLEFEAMEGKPMLVADLGIHWSTRNDTYAQKTSDVGTIPIRIKTTLTNDVVDWVATIESRMDYLHGDQEQEITLNPDAFLIYSIY